MEIDIDTPFYDAHFGNGALTFDVMNAMSADGKWHYELVWDWYEDHQAIFPW